MCNELKSGMYRLPNNKKLVETVGSGLALRIYSIGFKYNTNKSKEIMLSSGFQIVYNAKTHSFAIPENTFHRMEFLNNMFNADSCNTDDIANNVDSVLCNMSTSIVDVFSDGRVETYYPEYEEVKSHTYNKQKIMKCKQKFAMISW